MSGRALFNCAVFAAAVGSGIIGGIFYGFSSFIMPALARLSPQRATEAMNAINVTVLTPSFLGIFMGTALLSLTLVIGSLFFMNLASSKLVLAASIAYLVGCFLVTMLLNVPLNDELAGALEPARAAALWPRYFDVWTLWNTVRTGAALIAMMLFGAALLVRAP